MVSSVVFLSVFHLSLCFHAIALDHDFRFGHRFLFGLMHTIHSLHWIDRIAFCYRDKKTHIQTSPQKDIHMCWKAHTHRHRHRHMTTTAIHKPIHIGRYSLFCIFLCWIRFLIFDLIGEQWVSVFFFHKI